MEYTYLDLCCYLFIYSFIGWLIEVLFVSIKDREIRNRGFFSLPFCLSYGIIMDLLIVLASTMENNLVMEYLAALAISSAVTYLSGGLSRRLSHTQMWDYQENNLFAGNKKSFVWGLVQGALFLTAYLLMHPLFYIIVSYIPVIVKLIACIVIGVMLLFDFIIMLGAVRKRWSPEETELILKHQEGKQKLSERVYASAWRRLHKAYPNMKSEVVVDDLTFAKGICFEKLVWVFLVMSVGGVLFETVFVWATTGILMSRASFIYGPFSIVWGAGAVILTIILQRLKDKEDRFVFFAGCLLGGMFEYMCSVISEVVFGTVFWDYSDMPFNFGGRTNLLFCLFWGLLSVWWVKWMFPRLSKYIEKIPPIAGEVITIIIFALLLLDAILSGLCLIRYVSRIDYPEARNVIEQFLDWAYPNEFLEKIWPNMDIT